MLGRQSSRVDRTGSSWGALGIRTSPPICSSGSPGAARAAGQSGRTCEAGVRPALGVPCRTMRAWIRSGAGRQSASIASLSGGSARPGDSRDDRGCSGPRGPYQRDGEGPCPVDQAAAHPRRTPRSGRAGAGAVQQRLDRLVDALADGTLPADEIKARLSTEKARKTALTTDLARFERLAKVPSLNVDQIAQKLRGRLNDVAGVLGRQTVQARQMLRKILADKIELEPVGSGRQRGYKFRGALSLEGLIAGEAMNNTSDYGGPNGIWQWGESLPASLRGARSCHRLAS
jgi:hypothetical protein